MAVAYVLVSPRMFPGYVTDFDQFWHAARAWRAGADPYVTVQSLHHARGISFGLLYPFPAVVATWPLSFLPLAAARATVAGVGAGCFAYLLLGKRGYLYPALLSGAFRASLSIVQVAPLMACALMAPAFGWVAAIKPNIGLANAVALRDRRSRVVFGVSALALLACSLLLWPTWPLAWRQALDTATQHAPIVTRPGGFLLLLAALRWKRPEARWLLATALVPGNPAAYDALPLLVLLPANHVQALSFALLTHAADIGGYILARPDHAEAVLWLIYVPALVVILRRRNALTDAP